MPMRIIRYIYISICHPISHGKHKLIESPVEIAFLTLNKIIHEEYGITKGSRLRNFSPSSYRYFAFQLIVKNMSRLFMFLSFVFHKTNVKNLIHINANYLQNCVALCIS